MNLQTIHQTKIWAEFRKQAKQEKYFEIDCGINGIAYIQKMPLPRGMCWLYCSRGPAFKDFSQKAVQDFLEKVGGLANKEKAIFLRIEPPFIQDVKEGDEYEKLIKKNGFRIAHASHQPVATLIIELTQPLEKILADMKQKGRYNIKLAEKKGVKVYRSTDIQKDTEKFYAILKETWNRDEFLGHDKEFYKKMLEVLGSQKHAALYMAEYKGEPVCGIITTYFGDTATYYYGASSNKYREVMAPYLVQWTAICDAKKAGYKYYDFFGIAPEGAKKHPWQGVTEFKLKFGGRRIKYVKAREYIFKPLWYRAMKFVKKLKGVSHT
ncbi:peptidoglycan bridge formation glycyltransferase FemA/FemB family protein [Candidatus Peregrinibacteria bacterium]|nr:peptidoglycan bridge formation glycyltransferase FemA/FemB family protein [Candidatus Peregrinibacteria bacterium]